MGAHSPKVSETISVFIAPCKIHFVLCREQEKLLNHSLSEDDLAWRGMVLNNLIHDPKYFKHVESTGEVDVKFMFQNE
jgi:hypothetical protein